MTDRRMDEIIGYLLRGGVSIAAAVVAAGGVWYLASGSRPNPHAGAMIWAGLLILVSTPVARVIFSLIAFAIEGDRKFMVITSIVLAVLIYSLAFG